MIKSKNRTKLWLVGGNLVGWQARCIQTRASAGLVVNHCAASMAPKGNWRIAWHVTTGVIVYPIGRIGVNRPGNTAPEATAIEWQKRQKFKGRNGWSGHSTTTWWAQSVVVDWRLSLIAVQLFSWLQKPNTAEETHSRAAKTSINVRLSDPVTTTNTDCLLLLQVRLTGLKPIDEVLSIGRRADWVNDYTVLPPTFFFPITHRFGATCRNVFQWPPDNYNKATLFALTRVISC